MWYGSIASIPAGWILCNGAGGSPDLRNKFVVGAGDTYAVDANGGAVTHSHTFIGDGHTHDLDIGEGVGAGIDLDDTTGIGLTTGTTSSDNGLPPYHALAYIMKT